MVNKSSQEFQTIGQVSKLVGISLDTIRFYEKKGLLESPRRSNSGYRQYSSDAVRRIRFIQAAKEAGFSLNEIQELLNLKRSTVAQCSDVKERVTKKIEKVTNKIKELEQIKVSLETLQNTCVKDGPVSDCPILDFFDTVEEEKHG
jgi:MerR family transcriptional regulator, copper efflux regulator